jgi:hypothetical protein
MTATASHPWASWLTSTVVCIARGIHNDRDYDRCPILADALQDAGCEDAATTDGLRLRPADYAGFVGCLLTGKPERIEFAALECRAHKPDPDCPNSGGHAGIDRHYVGVEGFERVPCTKCWPRLAELRAAHLGPCLLCRDTTRVQERGMLGWVKTCTACVPARDRWDREPCPESYLVNGERYHKGFADSTCPICGFVGTSGTGDLFLRPTVGFRNRNLDDPDARPQPLTADRPIRTDRGRIMVGATLLEIARVATVDEREANGCDYFPTPWTRALLTARPDCGLMVEGVEPAVTIRGQYRLCRGRGPRDGVAEDVPEWAFDLLAAGEPVTTGLGRTARVFASPTAAHYALDAAVTRRMFGLLAA